MKRPKFTLKEYMTIAENMRESKDLMFKHLGSTLTYTKIEHREALANLFEKEFLTFLKKRNGQLQK